MQPADCQQAAAPNQVAAQLLAFAREQLGKPYVWGATGPDAFDCSGLTSRAYAAAGISIPQVAADQYDAATKIPDGQEQPGDLVFFVGSDGTWTRPGHVGMVYDTAQHLMIEAACTLCGPIRISSYLRSDRIGFGRFLR